MLYFCIRQSPVLYLSRWRVPRLKQSPSYIRCWRDRCILLSWCLFPRKWRLPTRRGGWRHPPPQSCSLRGQGLHRVPRWCSAGWSRPLLPSSGARIPPQHWAQHSGASRRSQLGLQTNKQTRNEMIKVCFIHIFNWKCRAGRNTEILRVREEHKTLRL